MTNQQEYIRLCSIPAVQEKIRERMGIWRIGDTGYDPIGQSVCIRFSDSFARSFVFPTSGMFLLDTSQVIHLPQVHNLQNPERGLEGMLKGEYTLTRCLCKDGDYCIAGSDEHDNVYLFHATTPELALLRALIHQWGLEGESHDRAD